ncbi:type II toxin-antitoxin system RelE/ParE family toxin [Pontibacillus sp. HMF3514]|nr:type II toxin-antitoxin system RelE/ParE family toxin [Pontibacillus sp. HMF3514]
MAEIIWAQSAVNDLDEICTYISHDSEEYARLFARRILEAIEQVATFPLSGKIVPELKNQLIRGKIHGNYRIIYRDMGEVLEVVRIMHAARDFE